VASANAGLGAALLARGRPPREARSFLERGLGEALLRQPITDAAELEVDVDESDLDDAVVFLLASLRVGPNATLRLTGSLPAVLASNGAVLIEGQIDASAGGEEA